MNSDEFKPMKVKASTPEEARDAIAALILDAATAVYEKAKGLKRKEKLRLGDQLTNIGERISALEFE